MINPNYIRTFLSLCETRHFTKTADVLNMTQPGVSQHLMKLETELETTLFHRNGKKIELTVQGEILQSYAIQQKVTDEALRVSLQEDNPTCGECRISCSGTLATQLYPNLLNLQQMHPNLIISLEAAPNNATIDHIKQRQFDLGLITNNPDDSDLETTFLGYEELCLVLPKGYSADWEDLLTLGYINHPNGAHYATQIFEQNYASDFTGFKTIPQKGYINQLSQILRPVSMGLGFTVLPLSSVKEFSDHDTIQIASLQKTCQESIYLIRKKYRSLPARYTMIEDAIRKSIMTE